MNRLKLVIILLLFLSSRQSFCQSSDFNEIIEHGIESYDKGDYKEALRLYNLAKKIDTTSGVLNYEIASTYLALKDTAKALAYCEKSIKSTDKLNELAFVLYGTILDGQNKSAAAIEKFTEGLKIYPNSSILHYNLALTYFNNYKDKEAEENAKKAIAINPQYASSHLILAYTMLAQKKRIPCIFALYNFLLLEPKGKRAEKAYKELNKQLSSGVTQNDSSKTTINLTGNNTNEFSSLEILLGIIEASKNTVENKKKMEEILFYENTKDFFAILADLPKIKTTFWTKYYIDYFGAMYKNNLVEPFCYYISQTKYDEDVSIWLKNHTQKIADLKSWNATFLR